MSLPRLVRPFVALAVGCASLLLSGALAHAAQIVVGSGPGTAAVVKRFPDSAADTFDTLSPFAAEFQGGVKVAAGSGIIVVGAGAGAGGGSQVKVYDANTLAEAGSFFAFDPAFTGGITVAAGDGRIAVGAGPGSGASPHVKLFNATTFAEEAHFFAFDAAFTGGVEVALGDGKLVVGAGPGGGPQVKIFNAATLALEGSFFAFDSAFTGGVDVAIGGGRIAVGAGAGAAAHIKVYDAATLSEVGGFFAFDHPFTGGVRVAIGDGKLVVGTASGTSQVKLYDLATLTELNSFLAFDPAYTAGVEVAVTASPSVDAPTGSTISSDARYAYAANFGWIDARSSGTDGVRLTDNVLSGWLYSANTGWIHVGDGTPANGVAYANDSATDYGVNVSPAGALSGHAWSPNLGWIAFEATYGKPAVARSTGGFTGHAWSANAGWIALGGFPGALVSTTRAEGLDTDADGLPDYYEIQTYGGIATTTGAADSDDDGTSNRDEYLAAVGIFGFTGGYTWSGGYIGAPHTLFAIQNWSPRVPPETFPGFNYQDTLSINAPGASVEASLYSLTVRDLNLNSAGGRLDAANLAFDTTHGVNIRAGTLETSGHVAIRGPLNTLPGGHARVTGSLHVDGTVTQAGDFSLPGTIHTRLFANDGALTFEGPANRGYLFGHFAGGPESSVTIRSAQVAPGETGHSFFNSWIGSVAWQDGGDFDLGARTWTLFSLQDRHPGDIFATNFNNRFLLGDVVWTIDDDAMFWVQSGSLTLYAQANPQVALENVTLANAGTLRFQVDEIALNTLNVTGHPVEIQGQNHRTTRIREVTQSPAAEGTLRANAFSGIFTLEQPVIEHAIELTLGRTDASTLVQVSALVNDATLHFAGSAGYSTSLIAPLTDTAESPVRTVRNDGTLSFGAGRSDIAPQVTNTSDLTVATGAEVALARPLDNQGTVTIAPGGRLVAGNYPVPSPEGPIFLPVAWISGHIANQGEFVLRGTALDYAPIPGQFSGQSITSTGNPVTLEDSELRLNYPAATPAISRFAFRGTNRVVNVGDFAKALFAGSYWRVEGNSTLALSSVVSAGTFEMAGSANGPYPTAFLNPSAEFINTGLFRTVDTGGILQGLLVNFGQIEITPASRLTIHTPLQDPLAAVPGRLVNHEHAGIRIAEGGMLHLSGGYTPTAGFEMLGGTLVNEGRFVVDYPTNFLFALGSITGNPVEVTNGTLQIDTFAERGTFLLHGPANTLALDKFHLDISLAAGLTLHVEGTAASPAALAIDGPFTQFGTLRLDSSDDAGGTGTASVSVAGNGLMLIANTGTLHLARAPGKNATRFLDLSLTSVGQIRFDDGVDVSVTKPNATFVADGPFDFGVDSRLTFRNDVTSFMLTPSSTLRGSGVIAFSASQELMQLLGTIKPDGEFSLEGSVRLSGRLAVQRRATSTDHLRVGGTINVTGSRVIFSTDTGVTVTPGTRYVVITAQSITGTLPALELDPKLAASFTGQLDHNGTSLGVTFTAIAPVGTNFQSWASQYQLANPAPNSDTDGDGIPLLVEYALDLNPTAASTAGLLQVSTTASDWVATYTRPADRPDLAYAVEFSTNLGSWTTTGGTHELVSTNAGAQTWRARVPLSSAANAFFRLRIDRP